jgi:hypothetical protein
MAQRKSPTTLIVPDNGPPIPLQVPMEGVVGNFLLRIDAMLRNRGQRCEALLQQIDANGSRMEAMLQAGAASIEGAKTALEAQLRGQGLLPPELEEGD